VSFATGLGQPRRWFVLEDELTFAPGGEPEGPKQAPPAPVERYRRYSWAYLLHRPRLSEPNIADLTIVLFSGRRLEKAGLVSSPTGEVTLIGPAGSRVFVANSTTATVSIAGNGGLPAPIKNGEWIFDATVRPGTQQAAPIFNGYFYRVVHVGEVYQHASGELCQDLELATPAKADGFVAVFMTGVVDVIEKNTGRMP
jgi:hypothetical protein